jgi:hypothetical protein
VERTRRDAYLLKRVISVHLSAIELVPGRSAYLIMSTRWDLSHSMEAENTRVARLRS